MKRLPKTISEVDLINSVKRLQDPKQKLALMLGFYQCMRVSEVANLTSDNVDLNRGFIHIKQAKGDKDRDVPIMKPVRIGLKHLPIGRTVRTLERWSKQRCGVNFHSLRHSGATYYLNEKGIDVRLLQQLLGHSRLDTTQIYTHVTPENLKNAFEGVWQ